MSSSRSDERGQAARRFSMKGKRTVRVLKYTGAGVLLAVIVGIAGCVRVSGGTWYVRSAPVPENWPELTPVGEVQVKAYPVYRAAVVADVDIAGAGMRPMFMELFRHIQSNKIAMTAPVEMGYDDGAAGTPRMESMAFLYRTKDQGGVGDAGAVRVRDFEPQLYASIGVRGDYTGRNFEKGLSGLMSWLDANADHVQPLGPPRYLGYNGPFVPKFMRYGEVQIPIAQ
jgi:hypothetical protein